MAKSFEVKLYPDPVLRERAKPVSQVGPGIPSLMERMAQTMYEMKGVGLAAPQVGVGLRVIVVDVGDGLIGLCNPEIVEEDGEVVLEEGCLSVPGAQVEVKRTKSLVVRGTDEEGVEHTLRAEDLLARVIQHEIDHLDGVLIVDKLTPEDRLKFDMEYSAEAEGAEPGEPAGRVL